MDNKQTLTDAAEEIAAESMREKFRSAITFRDALPWVDSEMVQPWLIEKKKTQTASTILFEALEDIDDAQAETILTLILEQTDASQALIAAHVRVAIANHLAELAEKIADDEELEASDRPTRRQIDEHNRAARLEARWEWNSLAPCLSCSSASP